MTFWYWAKTKSNGMVSCLWSGTGSGDKQGKVLVPTHTGNCIPRFPNLDKSNDYFSASRQDGKDSPLGKEAFGKECTQCERSNSICREDHRCKTGNLSGPFVSESPASPSRCHSTPECRRNVRGLQTDSGIIESWQERTDMVGSGSSEVELYPDTPSAPGLTIETDASQVGWGATCTGVCSGGLWSLEEQRMDTCINVLEVLVVSMAMKTFAKWAENTYILIKVTTEQQWHISIT